MAELIWEEAGFDTELLGAANAAKADRTAGIAEVLAASRDDFGLRARRSAVLATACADSDVAERWCEEDPDNPDALLLCARTAVVRALRFATADDEHHRKIVEIARRACEAAAAKAPEDPTPWVARLALASRGHDREPAPKSLTRTALRDLPGPWSILAQVQERDPLNREAYHWMLQGFLARNGGSNDVMWVFAKHVASSTPVDSDPQLLMLVAYVEQFRSPAGRLTYLNELQWRESRAHETLARLYERGWFVAARSRPFPAILDLSYLAYGLSMAGDTAAAHDVFEAMGRHAVPMPWSIHGAAAEQVTRARARCGASHPGPGPALRPFGRGAEMILRPAGADRELARAAAAAAADRRIGLAEVLADSRYDPGLRSRRSLVLAALCADSDIAEQWCVEDPRNQDAQLLYARTAVVRARRAASQGDQQWAELADIAEAACATAVESAPRDPTPWVARLDLARLSQWSEHGPAGLEKVLGPWSLRDQALKRDPFNREAHLRFLQCLMPRYGGSLEAMMDYAFHIASETPQDSDPQFLVLVALAERFRVLRQAGEPVMHQWSEPSALRMTLDLLEGPWFKKALERRVLPVHDLSYLAHGLVMAGRERYARDVFEAMGRYAASMPWSLHGDPVHWFNWGRDRAGLRHLDPPAQAQARPDP